MTPIFDNLPALPLRPNGTPARTITITQGFHEWVHALQHEGWNIADGSRGKPSYPADKPALQAMQQLMGELDAGAPYGTNPLGEPKWRAQAAEGFSREYGVTISPECVAFTPGGQFGLAATFYALEQACPDGVILAANPWYLNHEELASMFSQGKLRTDGRHPKFVGVDTMPTAGRMCAKALQAQVDAVRATGKPIAAFLFCNPSNPTGAVLTRDEWQAVAEVLRAAGDVPIVLDEAFAEVIFDEDFARSLLHVAPDLLPRLFLFRSGTKALSLAGERLAAQIIPPRFVDAVTAFQSRLLGNPPLMLQAGMAAGLATMGPDKKRAITQYYRGNFEYVYGRMAALVPKVALPIRPDGGFFLMAQMAGLRGVALPALAAQTLGKTHIENDVDVAFALLMGLGQTADARTGVAVIPASAFGANAQDMMVRISYSSAKEEITAICDRIAQAVAVGG